MQDKKGKLLLMDNDFETYLFISPKKLIISVNDKNNFDNLYKDEVEINDEMNQLQYDVIDSFLYKNIFLIEKILKNFIKKINLIISSEDFFSVQISLKKNNYGELINQGTLNYVLNEAKNQCKETIHGNKIIHMLVDNYLIDNNSYSYFPTKLKCYFFSLDLSFICLPEYLIKDLEKILRKYQISLNQILYTEYLKNFFKSEDIDIFNMANKIIAGCNENEIKLVNKTFEKKGIFERFFDLFS